MEAPAEASAPESAGLKRMGQLRTERDIVRLMHAHPDETGVLSSLRSWRLASMSPAAVAAVAAANSKAEPEEEEVPVYSGRRLKQHQRPGSRAFKSISPRLQHLEVFRGYDPRRILPVEEAFKGHAHGYSTARWPPTGNARPHTPAFFSSVDRFPGDRPLSSRAALPLPVSKCASLARPPSSTCCRLTTTCPARRHTSIRGWPRTHGS